MIMNCTKHDSEKKRSTLLKKSFDEKEEKNERYKDISTPEIINISKYFYNIIY